MVKRIRFLLKRLYQISGSSDQFIPIETIYPDSPDLPKIINEVRDSLTLMKNKEFIHTIEENGIGPVSAKILPEGKLFYERNRNMAITDFLKALGSDVPSFTDHSINVSNITGSNINVLSTDTTKIINVKSQINKILDQIEEKLKIDKSIPPETFEQLSRDINTVKSELSKVKPNKKIIGIIIENFSKFHSIATLDIELSKHVMSIYGYLT